MLALIELYWGIELIDYEIDREYCLGQLLLLRDESDGFGICLVVLLNISILIQRDVPVFFLQVEVREVCDQC